MDQHLDVSVENTEKIFEYFYRDDIVEFSEQDNIVTYDENHKLIRRGNLPTNLIFLKDYIRKVIDFIYKEYKFNKNSRSNLCFYLIDKIEENLHQCHIFIAISGHYFELFEIQNDLQDEIDDLWSTNTNNIDWIKIHAIDSVQVKQRGIYDSTLFSNYMNHNTEISDTPDLRFLILFKIFDVQIKSDGPELIRKIDFQTALKLLDFCSLSSLDVFQKLSKRRDINKQFPSDEFFKLFKLLSCAPKEKAFNICDVIIDDKEDADLMKICITEMDNDESFWNANCEVDSTRTNREYINEKFERIWDWINGMNLHTLIQNFAGCAEDNLLEYLFRHPDILNMSGEHFVFNFKCNQAKTSRDSNLDIKELCQLCRYFFHFYFRLIGAFKSGLFVDFYYDPQNFTLPYQSLTMLNFIKTFFESKFEEKHFPLIEDQELNDNGKKFHESLTFAHYAAFYYTEPEILDKTLDLDPDILEKKDIFGNTPIFYAIGNGHEKIVEYILGKMQPYQCGNETENLYKTTPFGLAIKRNNEKIITSLLEKGTNINCQKYNNLEAIYIAAETCSILTFKYILSKYLQNSNFNDEVTYNEFLSTCFYHSICGGNKLVCSYLLNDKEVNYLTLYKDEKSNDICFLVKAAELNMNSILHSILEKFLQHIKDKKFELQNLRHYKQTRGLLLLNTAIVFNSPSIIEKIVYDLYLNVDYTTDHEIYDNNIDNFLRAAETFRRNELVKFYLAKKNRIGRNYLKLKKRFSK